MIDVNELKNNMTIYVIEHPQLMKIKIVNFYISYPHVCFNGASTYHVRDLFYDFHTAKTECINNLKEQFKHDLIRLESLKEGDIR